MKKFWRVLFCLALMLTFVTACQVAEKTPASGNAGEESQAPAGDESAAPVEGETTGATEIRFWTYPVGKFANQADVEELIGLFNAKYPDIKVSVEYLDYTNGDDKVNTAIEGGQAPDVIFEGPERLVANWGAKGQMVDLSDLWTEDAKKAIYPNVEAACRNAEGVYYEFPICMTAHCMAINRDLFEQAGALQYLDEEKHTWTTENYLKAIAAVKAAGQENVTAVYCSGQGGDQGTRALVNNLYGGTFTNPEHTQYTVNTPENVKALQTLYDTDGIVFDAAINGGEEINLFNNGTLAVANCWNVSQEQGENAAKHSFDVLPMAFPTESGDPQLCGGIWGFGLFDNGDPARLDASKKFLDFFANDPQASVECVKKTTYWPVRDMGDVYAGDAVMEEYGILTNYLGDYYQVVPGWAEARTAWWNMLQSIGNGASVEEQAKNFDDTANAAATAAQ